MTRPTDGPDWATGGGNPSTWPVTKETHGYAPHEKLPAEDLNGILQTLGEWARYLDASAGARDWPGDAVDTLPDGSTFVLKGTATGAGITENIGTVPEATAVAHDGKYLVVLQNGDTSIDAAVHILDPSGVEAPVTFTGPNSATDYNGIACNGSYIVVTRQSGLIYAYNYSGNLLWDSARGGTLHDVCIDSERVYVCGVAAVASNGSLSREVQAWTLAGGALAWELASAHGATIYSIATNGTKVYYAGTANGGGENIQECSATSGAVGVPGTLGADVTGPRRIALGPNWIWALTGSSTGTTLATAVFNGSVIYEADTIVVGEVYGGLTLDDRYIHYCLAATNECQSVPAVRPAYAHYGYSSPLGGVGTSIVTDGRHVYSVNESSGNVLRASTGRRAGVWEVHDWAPNGHWFQSRIIPGE